MIEEFRLKIESLAAKIHAEFGEQCLILKHQYINEEERYALWSVTDVYLNTSVYQRMGIFANEYIMVRSKDRSQKQSCVLLPEFTGNNIMMKGAYLLDPYDVENICKKLNEAVSTPIEKNQAYLDSLNAYVSNNSMF